MWYPLAVMSMYIPAAIYDIIAAFIDHGLSSWVDVLIFVVYSWFMLSMAYNGRNKHVKHPFGWVAIVFSAAFTAQTMVLISNLF
jgi:hypothetical protein